MSKTKHVHVTFAFSCYCVCVCDVKSYPRLEKISTYTPQSLQIFNFSQIPACSPGRPKSCQNKQWCPVQPWKATCHPIPNPNAIASGQQQIMSLALINSPTKRCLAMTHRLKNTAEDSFFVQQMEQLHENVTSYGGHLDIYILETNLLCESPCTLPWFLPWQSTLLQEPGRWLDDCVRRGRNLSLADQH